MGWGWSVCRVELSTVLCSREQRAESTQQREGQSFLSPFFSHSLLRQLSSLHGQRNWPSSQTAMGGQGGKTGTRTDVCMHMHMYAYIARMRFIPQQAEHSTSRSLTWRQHAEDRAAVASALGTRLWLVGWMAGWMACVGGSKAT